MYNKGSVVSVAIIFIFLVVSCSPPDTGEESSNNIPIEESPSANQTPFAKAGIDRTILVTEAFAFDLDGSESYDPDGSDLNYVWTAEDETVTFDPDNQSISPTVNLPIPMGQLTPTPGDYVFVLIVDDGVNYSKPDIVIITIFEPDAWVDSELPVDSPEEEEFKTIQNAIDYIDSMSDGKEKFIVVINGPYYEKVVVKPNIHLIGLKPTSSAVTEMPQIIYDNDLDYRNAVVSLQKNSALENFEIACSACTYCDDCSGDTIAKAAINIEGENTEIKKCSIIGSDNSSYDGIWVQENMSATVTESEIKDVAGEGIQLEDGSSLVIENTLFFNTGGSSIWARGWERGINRVEVKNSISYHAGWHGFDFSGCNEVEVEHCTIVDFSWTDRCQSGIFIKCGNVSLKSNLIEIRGTLNEIATTTLRGVVYNETDNPCTPENENVICPSANITFLNNYIYSKQEKPIYYRGEIANEPVDPSNYPTSNSGTSSDPLLVDPDARNFSLKKNSPAIGLGENNSNPGAEGAILNP